MEKILEFLDGKKAKLTAIAGLIFGYLVAAGFMDAKLGALILSIINILAGTTAVITDKQLGSRKRNFNI